MIHQKYYTQTWIGMLECAKILLWCAKAVTMLTGCSQVIISVDIFYIVSMLCHVHRRVC